MMLACFFQRLATLKAAWLNRANVKLGFVYCDFEGNTYETQMYLHRVFRVSEHHCYLVGVLAHNEGPCSFRLDRVRGRLTNLRTKEILRRKIFLSQYLST